MKLFLSFFIFLLLLSGVQAQEIQFSGELNAKGILYSGERSPFWFHSNQRGRIDEISQAAGWITGTATYAVNENARLKLGVGGLYQDGYTDKVQLDESYLSFENNWLLASIGRKQREELYKGLSATNENIVWSLNARPLPGLSLKTKRPVYFWKEAGLAFQASLEEFFTDDERFVPDTRIHHKSLYLVFDKVPDFEFTLGLEHFVQWAGTSPQFGKLPGSLNDYLKIFAGSGSNEGGGNEINALGNHLGSYVTRIKTSLENYNVEIIYNHLFEDGSGMRLGNTPDGRYGIFIEDKMPGKWIDAFMYEFYYTKHQSHTSSGTDGKDNYFNNHLYRSGWTYENRILGLPFIGLDEERFRVNNNNVVAHHVGISGIVLEKMPYKLLTSFRKNYGAKKGGNLRSDILSTYLDLQVYQNILDVNIQVGADFSSIASPNFGAGIQLRKQLF